MFLATLLPLAACAAGDPLSTGQYMEPGEFPQTADTGNCDRDKISKPLNLADVVDLALCNNPQTRSLWASARAEAANVGVAMSAYLPTLSAQGSLSRNFSNSAGQKNSYNSRNASLTASYLLFDFGGRSATLENAKQLLVAASATRDATLQANFLTAVQSYYALLSARANVDALQIAEASAKESLAAADARYMAGVATPADKLQAQTALSQARLNLITAQGNERSAQGTLANIMGFDASQPFLLATLPESTPDPFIEQDIGKLIEEARRKRPDLQAAEAQIKAAEAQLTATRATGLPTVSLGASTGTQNISGAPSTNSSSIGVTLNVPLFTGTRNTYQNRAAEFQLEGKVAARELLANQIALDVWKSYQTLLTNSQSLIAASDLVASAEQSERMTLGRYKAGVANMSILDVLNAQSALASARQQRVAALYNFKSSRLALAQAIGQLDLTRLDAGN
ncbi:TolC family protein [Sideroxydans lithotrophicus]|uniref:Protein CyaE n=1 Tax=Sideroxydans lithotrophicus (strain ES-1) TaxID=580332 RepID=D5CRY8_SIDLE|nr:TolC family protein [Sideroxydans lithotrophicus]ADE11724.1 outer membrane efflux protein [Sideroxydans lithotrophicus ES-1]